MPHDAADVDPRAEPDVERERLVRLIEEERGVDPAARAAIEGERVAEAVEILRRAGVTY
jgi:hypothetical protein